MKPIVGKIIRYGLIVFVLLVLVIVALNIFVPKPQLRIPPITQITREQSELLLANLKTSGTPPEDYILSKFRQYDVVMLGEDHRIQHDALFVQRMIPILYKNSIHLLGFEFACTKDQERIDRLLGASSYDEHLAIDILRNFFGIWPYKEYLDIFRSAWLVNSALPAGSEPFRILALTPWVDYDKLRQESGNDIVLKTTTPNIDSMAAVVVEREALLKGKKIMVYCGRHHAFSRFQQPMLNDSNKFTGKYFTSRAGTRILQSYPGKVTTILLDFTTLYRDYDYHGLPFYGIIDQVFASYKRPVGFNTDSSAFGSLIDSSSIYSFGYGKIRLADLCDGFIILDEMKNYRSVTLVDKWLDDISFGDFKRRFAVQLPWYVFHPRLFMWLSQYDLSKVNEGFQHLSAQLETEKGK